MIMLGSGRGGSMVVRPYLGSGLVMTLLDQVLTRATIGVPESTKFVS